MAGLQRLNPETDLSKEVRSAFYIGGAWRAPATSETFDLIDPVTEELFIKAPQGSAADMDAAIKAARDAFDNGPWGRTTPQERAPYLRRIAEEMDKRTDLFLRAWMSQVGVPQNFSGMIIPLASFNFTFYADQAATFPYEREEKTMFGRGKVLREPVGVAALIVPWNAPLVLLTQKLSAALAAGCTVVVKPSPETPLDALILAECVQAAGLPPGVVNVVPAGREAGDHLIRQPQIDKVSFTGSTAAGKHIAQVCADRLARVSLELGGKSAAILLEDADLDAALPALVPFTMPFSGQICFSQTRVLVPRKRHDEMLDRFVAAVKGIKVGDPWDAETQMGPVSMSRQLDRVRGYIDIAKNEGARLVEGGGNVEGMNRGYFIQPTVFDQVTSDMRVAQEEVFGPVISVMTYEDDEDAIRIANDSSFGLSGSVYSPDIDRAEKVARRVRTGNISVNHIQLDPTMPFGGYKQSGIGREAGIEGLEPYLETKTLYLPA